MAKNKATFDVFLVYDRRDVATVDKVTATLISHDLTVFWQHGRGGVIYAEDVVWSAMAESQALVVVLPQEVTPSFFAFELGAAKAWNKPIYAVSAFSSHQGIPLMLQNIPVLPLNRIDEIADSIAKASDPLTDRDVEHLSEAYLDIGVPADQLSIQPQQLARLVKHFNKNSGRNMSGEQILRHILRLRKSAKLPVLKKH